MDEDLLKDMKAGEIAGPPRRQTVLNISCIYIFDQAKNSGQVYCNIYDSSHRYLLVVVFVWECAGVLIDIYIYI